MLSSSEHREGRPLGGHVDTAESSHPTSPFASPFQENHAARPRSCDRHSSSTTHLTSPWLDGRSATSTSLDADDEGDAPAPEEPAPASSSLPSLTLAYEHRQRAGSGAVAGDCTPAEADNPVAASRSASGPSAGQRRCSTTHTAPMIFPHTQDDGGHGSRCSSLPGPSSAPDSLRDPDVPAHARSSQSESESPTSADGGAASPSPLPLVPPLSAPLRLPSRSTAELQQYGCCVFFFPAPFVSWLFPLVGHVAISNAEGSRLYTFESSYYVREEKLVCVLDKVLRGEALEPRTASVLRGTLKAASPVELSVMPISSPLQSPTSSPPPGRPATGDASASDVSLTSLSDASAGSPQRQSVAGSTFPSRASARPPRRTGRPRSGSSAHASGHAHTPCVRIWDLKPLLMESRGRRTRRTPYGFSTTGGRQAAAALWERLQELLQSTDIAAAATADHPEEAAARTAASATPSAVKRRCGAVSHGDDGAGARVAPGTSSSSSSGEEEEEEEYELLDAETARFYNRNLNATIRLFRGSADGSINSPDVVLQHHSSFSFVGFVLEACGVGSQGRAGGAAVAAASSAAAAPQPGGSEAASSHAGSSDAASGTTAAPASSSDDAVSGGICDSEEEIHWGVMKMLFHVFIFGKWHRGERRLWRVVHGGSITSATILWVAVVAVLYHYFALLFL
ncbi:hypothetical protein NESM_000267900 [Novymonas esmeraldas]|uniref:Uncharacterized protein n=1 Tax=Novymonas esmeraldas TaxID=1808958 RepID=A0AAW0F729_9TRYP